MTGFKGKALVGLASVAMLGGVALGSTQAFAAFPNTDATVKFASDGGHVENPNPDALAIVHVPESVNFGNNHTAGNALSATGVLSGTNGNYITIRDAREASESTNWTLKASASSLTNTDNGVAQTISNGDITIGSTESIKDWTYNIDPTVAGAVGADTTVPINKATSVTLPLGGAAVELADTTASERQGYAVPISSMNLNVVSTQESYRGIEFAGTIQWALEVAP